ncbi:MAG: hypothetical protein ACFBWO_00085 [Paracoccaceae bacterium]
MTKTPRRHATPYRALLAALAFLAACDAAPPDVALPDDTAALPRGTPESLPTGLWTTRLGGGVIEAAISDGSASLGVACDPDARLLLRYRPAAAAPSGDVEAALAAGAREARVRLATRDENWRGTASSDTALADVLGAVAAGRALAVSVAGRPTRRFGAAGAGEALASALGPRGCLG